MLVIKKTNPGFVSNFYLCLRLGFSPKSKRAQGGIMLVTLFSFLIANPLWAQVNPQSNTGHDASMERVQQELRDPVKRQKMIDSDAAKQADQNVKSVGGSEMNQQQMYELSAEVFGNFKGKSPEEMDKLLEEAQKNPEAFMNSWSPEQKAKLKQLSNQIEEGRKKNP